MVFSGYETARSLALHGCTVVMACRNIELAQDAASTIIKEKHDAKLDPMFVDFQRLSTVEEFATRFMSKYPLVLLLVINFNCNSVYVCVYGCMHMCVHVYTHNFNFTCGKLHSMFERR